MPDHLLDIIKEIKRGKQDAFRLLIDRFQHKAFGLALRILGDEEEARDVVQDSFISIWEKINTYKTNEKFSNWMYKIVSNRAIDTIRSRQRKPVSYFSAEQNLIEKFQDEREPEDVELENRELGQLITLLTKSLPEKQSLVFSLRDLQGMNVDEVMAISGQSESQIKSNLHHARKTIREKLKTLLNYESKLK
jgi:RNA polymerase sigma-70 factor (ECF subfamily)